MQWLARVCVHRPVFATVLILLMVVVGIVGFRTLGVDKYPKIDFPAVTINTQYKGASPTAVETDVTLKIEEAVNTVTGLDTLTSQSTEGNSFVIAMFSLETDPDQAVQDINEKVSGMLGDLPGGASRPEVKKSDPDAAPIIVLSVKGPNGLPKRELTRFAEKSVKQRLERVAGVGQVSILGGQERQINVHIDAMKLQAASVSAIDVERAIAAGNVSVPGGRIEKGPNNLSLRVESRVRDPKKIGNIIVKQHAESPVRVADVATVVDAEEDADSAASRNGTPAIVLLVRKQTGTNTVAVVDALKKQVAELAPQLPAGYSVDVVRDNSVQIRVSTHQVLEHLVLGSLFAALVVLFFLGSLRSTIIAAVSMPVSIVATFGLMMVAGFTLNMMTLLALALAVGIVIDDAIVVLENIHRYIHEKKMQPFEAAIQATKEIGLAVLATTFSLMAVFLPVAFMSGIVGRFLQSFGLTMAFAILVSMIVAFTLTPMMAARMLPPPPDGNGEHRKSWLERASDWVYAPMLRAYSAMLRFCLRRRWVVGLAIVGSCATMIPLKKQVGGDFLPPNDDAQFEIYVQMPEGTSLVTTTLVTERLARRVRQLSEVDSTLVTVADTDLRQSNVGRVYAHMVDPEARSRDQRTVMQQVREDIAKDAPPGARIAVQEVGDLSMGGKDAMVTYVINGPDLDKLQQYSDRILARMKEVPGVVDLDTSLTDAIDESTVVPDLERAASLGVDPSDITHTLAILIGGVEASTFEDRGDQYPVWVRAAERFRTDPSALALINVPSKTVGSVPLSDVITVSSTKGPSKISREARERAVTITMNIQPGIPESAVVKALEKELEALDLPPGYTAAAAGRSKEMAKMQAAFMFAIILAVVFMYLVLAAQFESWLHPFTILLSLPLTVPFAMMSLAATKGSLNIFSMLGIIVLFAMVKKNAILQVDHTNELRHGGMERDAAVLQASADRLKPILMTTLAFVAGMAPLVTASGIGSGFSKAMASVVVGGQTLSLLLTLLAIPVIYTWFDDLKRVLHVAWAKTFARWSRNNTTRAGDRLAARNA
ncbi:MAG: efflux RND transporter permease subunit [Kofleriaceae bacterium]